MRIALYFTTCTKEFNLTPFTCTDLTTTDLSWVKVAGDLHWFASKSLALCNEDDICDFTMVAKFMRILSVISLHCESTDFQVRFLHNLCSIPTSDIG